MADLSVQRAVSDGTLVRLDLQIEFMPQSRGMDKLHVYINGVEAAPSAWALVDNETAIAFTPAIGPGLEVLVARATLRDKLWHAYSKGAAFTAEVLDESLTQVLHIMQEAVEQGIPGDFFKSINMHGNPITGLPVATDPTSPVTLGQLDNITPVTSALRAFATDVEAAAALASMPVGSYALVHADAAYGGNTTLYIRSLLGLDYMRTVYATGEARSVRKFGAVLDGSSNCATAVLAAIAAGVVPIFDGPAKVVPASLADAATLLASSPTWKCWARVDLQLPSNGLIQPGRVLNYQSMETANLYISGSHTNCGAPLAFSVVSSTPRDHYLAIEVGVIGPAKVGDFLMIQPNKTNTSDLCDFIAGSHVITNINGGTITFRCHNADSIPAITSIADAAVYIVHCVVQQATNQIGLRANNGAVNLLNVAFKGTHDPTQNGFDGVADGLQVGGAPDTANTGLNASEQLMGGVVWCSRVIFSHFGGNGTQVLGGRLVGVLMHTGNNAWRGQQSAGAGYVQVKSSVSHGNGATAYETEELGSMNCHDSWAVGNQQAGVFAIGNSQVSALGIRSKFNRGTALDARNGGRILADAAKVVNGTGAWAIYANGGQVLVGDGATVSGQVRLDECATVIAKGAASFPATPNLIEEGCRLQLPDGSLYLPINQLVNNSTWKFRVSIGSTGIATFGHAPYGSSTWVSSFNIGSDGSIWPAAIGRILGRNTDRWANVCTDKVTLGPTLCTVFTGAGVPNGSVSAVPGSLYINESGGAGATLWVKESGTGNTGWVAK